MLLRKGLSFLLVLLLVVSASASAFAAIPTFIPNPDLADGELLVFPGGYEDVFDVVNQGSAFGWLIQHSETGKWVGFQDMTDGEYTSKFFGGFDGTGWLYEEDDFVGFDFDSTQWSDLPSSVTSKFVDAFGFWVEPNKETKLTLFGFDKNGVPKALTDFYYTYVTAGVKVPFDKFSFTPAFIQKRFSMNKVTSFGPHFRDMPDPITKKWYMFTPLTLEEGKQEFPLIGGNQYIIGKVIVTVKGDEVATTYKYRKNDTYNHGEFFTFFPDFDSITSVDPADIGDSLTYKKPYSIANDLGGDTEVILYVQNIATFTYDSRDAKWKGNDRFWENQKEYKALRNKMLDTIGLGWIAD